MADQTPLPGKKDVARALLLKGTVFVHLDPRKPDVAVPNWFKHQSQLVLQIGLDMPIPIPDLRVDDHGVFGTLSFNKSPFTCSVPWDAVFAVVGDDGKGMVWPESMPPEIAAEVDRETRRNGIRTVPPLRPKPDERKPLEEVRPNSPSLRPAPVPAEALLDDDDTDVGLQPPADLSARRDSRAPVANSHPPRDSRAPRNSRAPMGRHGQSDDLSRSSDSWRPRATKKKVKLPPYLRVVK